MLIKYKTKKLEQICTNYNKAQKMLPHKIHAEKLMATINFIKNSKNFFDIISYIPFHFHKVADGKYAIDINGRKCSYRLIIVPIESDCSRAVSDANFLSMAKSIEIVMIEEVSNHYE